MIRLVVNAEDFGSSAEANAGAVRAHHEGIVTSASLLGNCDDLESALRALRDAPTLGTGLALALIGGRPLTPPAEIGALGRPDGRLRERAVDFAIDWTTGAIAPAHVERELQAQIDRARAAGLAIDHLATVGNLGFLPGVGKIVETLGRRFGIPGLRASVEPPGLGWIAEPRRGLETAIWSGLAWMTRRRLGSLRHGPQTWGYVEADRLDEVRILEIIGRLGPGAHELLCHPGGPGGAREIAALASSKVKTAIAGRGIVLCRWRDLF